MTDNNRLTRMKISRVIYTLLCLYPKTAGLTVGLRGTCGVIGNELILDCSLDGDTWNAASSRQWRGPPSLSLFIDTGTVQPGIDGYQETIDHVATTSIFSFTILNLTWSDVDEQYQCIYKFATDQYTINSSLIEDYKSTVANYSEQTKGMDIKATITLDKITPVPTAEVILTTTSMTTDVTSQALTITSTRNGNLTRVEIVVKYTVSDRNDYITVNLTTPCGYSKSFRFSPGPLHTTTEAGALHTTTFPPKNCTTNCRCCSCPVLTCVGENGFCILWIIIIDGVVTLLCIVCIVCIFLYRKRRENKNEDENINLKKTSNSSSGNKTSDNNDRNKTNDKNDGNKNNTNGNSGGGHYTQQNMRMK